MAKFVGVLRTTTLGETVGKGKLQINGWKSSKAAGHSPVGGALVTSDKICQLERDVATILGLNGWVNPLSTRSARDENMWLNLQGIFSCSSFGFATLQLQ